MSINSLTRLAAQAGPPDPSPPPTPPKAAAPSDAVDLITSFIPTEIVAAYISCVGIVEAADPSFRARLTIAIIAAVLIPFFVWVGYAIRQRTSPTTGVGATKLLVLIFLALLSFATWVAALPSSPYLQIGGYKTWMGGIAVVFVAGTVAAVGKVLGLGGS